MNDCVEDYMERICDVPAIIDAELTALETCYAQLRSLDRKQQVRVLGWLKSRLESDERNGDTNG